MGKKRITERQHRLDPAVIRMDPFDAYLVLKGTKMERTYLQFWAERYDILRLPKHPECVKVPSSYKLQLDFVDFYNEVFPGNLLIDLLFRKFGRVNCYGVATCA